MWCTTLYMVCAEHGLPSSFTFIPFGFLVCGFKFYQVATGCINEHEHLGGLRCFLDPREIPCRSEREERYMLYTIADMHHTHTQYTCTHTFTHVHTHMHTYTCTVPAIIKVTFRFSATIVALRYGFWFRFVLASYCSYSSNMINTNVVNH